MQFIKQNAKRRTLLAAGFAVLYFVTGIASQATAQGQTTFPTKPIKLIIGFPPGGPLDTHARVLTDQLQKTLGQPIIVDYKPGAGGTIGAN
ncbi:MAG: hypothetical protein ACKO15_16530, partial [Burkholderiales bacterium]